MSSEVKFKRLDGLIVALTGPGEKPFIKYEVIKPLGLLRIISTYVPPQQRGRGLAELLVKEAIKIAKEENLKIEPICSYALYYFIKNKHEREVLADWLRNKTDEELNALYQYILSLEKK